MSLIYEDYSGMARGSGNMFKDHYTLVVATLNNDVNFSMEIPQVEILYDHRRMLSCQGNLLSKIL